MLARLRIALTGGIGSGKSTVTSLFQELGTPIIDSDVVARDIVKPDSPCLNAIINEFGVELLTNEGYLNRSKLREIIFNDNKNKIKLEAILHPVIYKEIESQIAEINYPYCLIVIPLLIETKAIDRFDRILLVDTDEELQIKRASNRDNVSSQTIKKIMKYQASRQQRLECADDIINNTVEIEKLNESVLTLHKKYLKLSSNNHKINE